MPSEAHLLSAVVIKIHGCNHEFRRWLQLAEFTAKACTHTGCKLSLGFETQQRKAGPHRLVVNILGFKPGVGDANKPPLTGGVVFSSYMQSRQACTLRWEKHPASVSMRVH